MKTKQYPQTLQQHYRTFWEQDFLTYRLLIIPMLYLVSGETISRLKTFVADGSTLVMTI